MNKACLRLLCSLSLALAPGFAWAQVEINSSPNVVGSGARALGMGSAFIAIADDATAASWNPGGLTQLERPELSLVYNYRINSEHFESSTRRGMNFDSTVRVDELNYASFVYPIPWTLGGRNFVVSLNLLKQFDFDRDLDFRFDDIAPFAGGGTLNRGDSYQYRSRGALSSLSPAFGFEITDKLSMGVTWNIYNHDILPDNEWKTRNNYRQSFIFNNAGIGGTDFRLDTVATVEEEFRDFDGQNFTIGMLYKPNERWSIGAVYHTKWTADVKYRRRSRFFTNGLFIERQERDQQITFPSALGVGVAYRFPNDKLTLSFDVTRREWDQFEILDPENGTPAARRRSGITGLNKNLSDIDPTYTVRLGGEYVFIDDTKPKQDYLPSLRAGVFYDPEPSGGRKNDFWGIFPAGREAKGNGEPVDFWGFSLGAGVLVKDRVNIDLAYIYRWGDGARTDTFGVYGTDADVEQHNLYVSTVVYF